MRYKVAYKLVTLLFLFYTIISLNIQTFAAEIDPVDASINLANSFMGEYLQKPNFFKKFSEAGKEIQPDLAVKGNPSFQNKPVFIYGTDEAGTTEATKYGNDTRRDDGVAYGGDKRALGFSMTDDPYSNPDFYIDDVTYVRRWIKEPWKLPGKNDEGITKELSPDNPKDTHKTQWLEYKPDTFASTYSVINQWVKSKEFVPDKIEKKTGNRKFFNDNIHEDLPDGLKNNPEDYIYIIQPPTEESWGIGIAFYYYGGTGHDNMSKPNNYSYYQYFRFEPFSLKKKDLSASFDALPSSVAEGKDVLVTVNVGSTFDQKLDDVPFNWVITKEDGTPLTEEDDNLKFTGDSKEASGLLDIPKDKKQSVIYASFKMPDQNVKIKFDINKAGDKPSEENLINNVLDSGAAIKVAKDNPVTDEEFILDYNVLSRKVKFPLSLSEIAAALFLPSGGTWDGNATGSLGVDNEAEDLFRSFTVENNPPVNEAAERFVRDPEIRTTFFRSSFGDNPPNRIWINGTHEMTKSGSITYEGTVSRPYKYIYYDDCGDSIREDGTTYCGGHTGRSSTSADFNSGSNTPKITIRIYNGKEQIKPKIFKNEIDNNTQSDLKKNMFWTSEPYMFNVIRWMCHQDVDDSLYDWVTVPGQYQRIFTQQDTAEIQWSIASSLENDYKQSREAARNRYYNKSVNDKAVFASDVDYKSVDYPIKSGYYFNPTGTYTFTVKTVTYKTTTADTKEHKDLVRSVTNSFRYQTDLMYINSDKVIVNIQNEPLSSHGNSYSRKAASLTAQNPTGVDAAALLTVIGRNEDSSRYSKEIEEIKHSEEVDGFTHTYWKEILEGYEESNTEDSSKNYKYREYVEDGQHMYKITEETTVTIKVNPLNLKVYTYANMPNGNYSVKAWIDDIDLSDSGNEYKKIGTLKGITLLDKIEVSVKGSIFDDTY